MKEHKKDWQVSPSITKDILNIFSDPRPLHNTLIIECIFGSVFQVLMTIADDFIDNVVNNACILAKHRKANSLDVKDVQLHLGTFH
jgi:hypothetical protein